MGKLYIFLHTTGFSGWRYLDIHVGLVSRSRTELACTYVLDLRIKRSYSVSKSYNCKYVPTAKNGTGPLSGTLVLSNPI